MFNIHTESREPCSCQEFLQKIDRMDAEIQRLVLRRDTLRAIAESTVTVLRIDNVTGSHNNRKLEDLLNESAELDRKIDELVDRLVDFKTEFFLFLQEKLSSKEASVVFLRDIEKLPWPQIARQTLNCKSYVLKAYNSAWKILNGEKI